MANDEAIVEYKVGKREDEGEWHLTVICKEGLSEMEFAAAVISLAKDILDGKISFDDLPDEEPVLVVDDSTH